MPLSTHVGERLFSSLNLTAGWAANGGTMALLERVATILRANLNDLIDRAEDPEKMLKQLVLDTENHLLQVKTQVAMAIAEQHLLEKKKTDHEQGAEQWTGKAALAVARGRDDMARQALERSLTETRSAQTFAQQLEHQRTQTESLRSNYLKLQQKLAETNTRCEALIASHRRARTAGAVRKAVAPVATSALDRYAARVSTQEAHNYAAGVIDAPTLEGSFQALERNEQVEALLDQLKNQRALGA